MLNLLTKATRVLSNTLDQIDIDLDIKLEEQKYELAKANAKIPLKLQAIKEASRRLTYLTNISVLTEEETEELNAILNS